MGYFDGLTDASFKTDAEGRHLFYPWGPLSSGFIIETEERFQKIRQFYKIATIIAIISVVVIQATVGWWLNAALLPIVCLWHYFAARGITKNLQPTTEKLGVTETYENSAKSYKLSTLILLEFLSIGFTAGGVWMLQSGEDPLMAYAAIVLFGLGTIAVGYMIFAKIRQKSSSLLPCSALQRRRETLILV
jgi:hypothetical protein